MFNSDEKNPSADSPFDTEALKHEAERLYKKSIQYITGTEIASAAKTGLEKIRKLEDAIPPHLGDVWQDVKLLVTLLRDYVSGAYKQIPLGSIAAVAAAVLYFVSPIDAIPDFIPGIGYLDDAAVLLLCKKMVRGDLEKYSKWQAGETGSK